MIKRLAFMGVVGLLGACAAVTPITRLVRVTHTVYLPIPAVLLLPCKTTKTTIRTNGDLLNAYLATMHSLTTCNAQLHQIGTLKAPPSATR